jgi:predicted Zn-dependent peptidase
MLKQTELSNGLKIITEKIPDIHSASITILIGVGSAAEDQYNNGISHFVEHLLFKGTETRSSQVIAQSIEDYGGSLNAFTEKEMTCYYARVLTEQIYLTLDIFCDMLLNSLYALEELELERQVILEEIKMYEDTPDELVYDLLFKTIWGNNPLALPVTGSYNSVSKLTRGDIIDFVKNYYTPDNIIFSISGNFDHDKVIGKIKQHFEHIKLSKKTFTIETPVLKPAVSIQSKDIEQAHVCLATKGLSISSPDRYPLAVIDIALAGGISSRLFQEVREKRGLVYSINSYKALYRQSGVFGVYAGTSVQNINEVLRLVMEEFNKIKEEGLSEDELIRAKKQLKGSLLLGLESSYYRAYRNAHSEIYFGKIYSVEEICELIDDISMEDLKRVAEIIFDDNSYALSIVGPKNLPAEYTLKHPSSV